VTSAETQKKSIGGIFAAAAAAAAAAIVVLDFVIPFDFAVPMLFVLPILLTRRIPGWRSTVFLTGGVVLLSWVGPIYYFDEVTSVIVGNRALTSFLLLVVAGLLLKEKLLAQQRATDLMALRESEERFRTMAEAVPSFLFETDAAGRHVWTSEGWCRFTGQTPEQVAGHGWVEALHPDDRTANIDRWMQCMADGTPFESQQRLRRVDGTYASVIARALPVRDSRGEVTRWVGSVTNVDDIVGVQKALRESEQRFTIAFQTSPNPIGITEVATGRCIEVNEACLRLFGFSREEVIGNTTLMLDIWPNPEDRVRLVERLKAGKPVRNLESSFKTKSGALRHVLVSSDLAELGGTLCLITVGNDITERKQAEDMVLRTAADLAEAQRIAQLGSWRFDVETDRIALSDQLCTMFDVEPSPLGQTYESFLALVHPDDRPGIVQANVEARAHGTSFDMEFRFVKQDGSMKVMRELGYASRDAAGRVVGLFGTVQDITKRKQVETALRESEERLLLALESANMGTWEWDAETDSLLCNHWQFTLFGVRVETGPCTGTEALSRIHADDRARVCTAVRRVLEEGVTARDEFRVVHTDGSVHWLFGSGRPVQDGYGRRRFVVGVCLDITERRQNQERMQGLNEILETCVRERTAQLVEANERWDWVVRATNDAIWDWDLLSDTAYFSPRWKEMHGFQANDQPESREDWQRRIHPEDQQSVLSSLEEYLRGERGQFWEEYRVQRKDGTYIWVLDRGVAIRDEKGQAVRMVGAETDITWRKGVEQEVRLREQQFHTLADNVPALFAYVDRDGRYRFVNKQYEQLFGHSDKEIESMSVSALLGLEGYEKVKPYLDKALAGEPVSFEYELEVPGGSLHVLSTRYVPDRSDQGEVIGLFALSTDITALKSTEGLLRDREAQLRDLGAKLLQAQEEERRRISRDLHDDVMQRMGALALELYGLASSAPSQDLELLSQLKACGASAEQLTTDLQRMAHQLHPSVLEFGGLEMAVREQVNDFGARTGLSAELITQDVPKEIPLDHATCLYRVLQEGLQNVQRHADANTVLVRLLGTGRGLGLCVHDDGHGFEEINGVARRKGLGLTSMAERVGMLRGTFRVKTKPGDGTELHAWVPLENVKGEA